MLIRPITEFHEFQQCFELQRDVFGVADADLFPARSYTVLNSIGGLILGAFEDATLTGYLSTMPAVRDGAPYWYSQVMAVRKYYWNVGTAEKLKHTQRDAARQRGIKRIEWTFDPLESKNAYLNIAKLGVIVRRYHVNYYGRIESQLHGGLDTDRLVAEWWIDKPRVETEGDVRRIHVPADIQALKKENLKSAEELQLRVREEFLKNFQDDYYVARFDRKGDWGEYLFLPGASSVYPPS